MKTLWIRFLKAIGIQPYDAKLERAIEIAEEVELMPFRPLTRSGR